MFRHHHHRLFFFCLFFIYSVAANAQSRLPEYGKITEEEIRMKECSFDKEAEAVILFDDGVTDYDNDYSMITKRRIRIKILNEKGLKQADIRIPFYSKDGFEYIQNVEGATYNYAADGSSSTQVLEKSSVFTEKLDNIWSQVKFAMPSVKAGSIIEYRYESVMKSYGGLEYWDFQSSLPTMKSCYMLQIVPIAEFAYSVQKKKEYAVVIKPLKESGRIYFEMSNVAALRLEPYMDAPKDYLQRVSFQLAGISDRFAKEEVNTTWKSLAYELMTDKAFGAHLDKDLKADDVKALAAAAGTAWEKLRAIYNYVRDNVQWNGYYGKYAQDGLKKLLESKKGNAGEINLLLVNLLLANGIEAYPLLAAERDFGKINPSYPFLDRFNKVVAFAIADGRQCVLDATLPYAPAGLNPYQLLNTTAFLVDKKKFNLLKIENTGRAYKNKVYINASLNKEGILTGEVKTESYDYAKVYRTGRVKENRDRFISEVYQKPYEGLTIDSFRVVHPDKDSLPLEQYVKFKQQLNESGGFIFINSSLFTGLEKNPFTSSVRFTNINFGYPYETVVAAKIKLPPGSKLDIPEEKMLGTADNTIGLSRLVTYEKGELTIQTVFRQATTLFQSEQYNWLKEFYKQMVDYLNDPIVIKLGN